MATKIKTLCPGISVNIAQDIKSVGITLSISDYARGLCITGKTWLNRVGKFTSFATALKYKLSSHSLIDKIPKMAVGRACKTAMVSASYDSYYALFLIPTYLIYQPSWTLFYGVKSLP